MKTQLLAIALLAACTTAHAMELAKWKNDDNTHVLTDETGACTTVKGAAVIRIEGPAPREGCYTLDEKQVYIVWSDATSEQLPIRKFRPTREAIAAAQKERMDRDEMNIKAGMENMKRASRPPPPVIVPNTTPKPNR